MNESTLLNLSCQVIFNLVLIIWIITCTIDRFGKSSTFADLFKGKNAPDSIKSRCISNSDVSTKKPQIIFPIEDDDRHDNHMYISPNNPNYAASFSKLRDHLMDQAGVFDTFARNRIGDEVIRIVKKRSKKVSLQVSLKFI